MTIQDIDEEKIKLIQKKNRLIAEETKLKLKERKMRTRHLIEIGGLIVKAKLDTLPVNTLYGAFLSLQKQLNDNSDITDTWTELGKAQFNQDAKTSIAVILKFFEKPDSNIRQIIRKVGLRFNKFRNEWYGNVKDIGGLKNSLGKIKYDLEILQNL